MKSDLEKKIFQEETAAREFLEAQRWPDGVICPHCGATENIRKLEGKSHRPGLYQCNGCREHFTVTVGTLYERSHIPLHKWLLASYLLSSSKKGMSAHQLHRMLGITYKSAWFMAHRIRESMKPCDPSPLGGEGKTVEADETFVGGKEKNKHAKDRKHLGRGAVGKEAVFSLVERGGKVRSTHVKSVTSATLGTIMREQLNSETHLMTDDARQYIPLGKDYAAHDAVKHSIGEYVRGGAHTNTIEGYFSIFKRGMTGVYQHCNEKHLKRYLAEFDFRYNERSMSDMERTQVALKGIEGKRLTYRRTNSEAA